MKDDLKNDFAWTVYKRYWNHCTREEEQQRFQHFTKYLISCGIIGERTVQRFMVNELYPQALACSGGRKLQAIAVVSEETGIPERTVRFMVDNPERYGVK